MAFSGAERQKRFKQRRSLRIAELYLAKDWSALGSDTRLWTARHCASRKRWIIWYARRKQAQLLGFPPAPRRARHWVGPIERAKKQAKALRLSVNPFLVRHL